MSEPLTLGVAGLGTVGMGLIQLLSAHATRIEKMLGRPITVTGVSARSRKKEREAALGGAQWFDDPVALAKDPSNSVFIELMGGEDGPAKAAVEAALKAKKHVVTANKALLAKHGIALAKLAESNGVALNFEAAVAGGIPIIKMLREALAANEVRRVYGILNGTCNFILSKMTDEKRAFADALKEAQEKGYAEADPTFDIGGFDAAHKLSLLTCLAFGAAVAFDEIHVEGIENITSADIEAATELGYCIKLLGVAMQTEHGIEARVTPVLVAEESALAEVSGVTNCVGIDGDFAGNLLLVGPGAGSKPTASAVASDIMDVARGLVLPPFIRPTSVLEKVKGLNLKAHQGNYYVRLKVYDRPGAMAAITKRMSDENVSLESIVQRRPGPVHPGQAAEPAPGEAEAAVNVILITHDTTEDAMRKALRAIEKDGKITERPQMIRIEDL
ncbi:homoserine dehydrogenase [Hyphomicrobium sp.]|uniref:homoserine dehydrogenase n=1 Tax=Hyphomicrobium sp. TaxID=82 RepID=UPI002E2FC34E|nr:homoserine dehydrogenase [Hyphomicrobium sp.]HEX2842492.1 homoserine dehydrogenase [Hyphomicrobium sp.]